MTDYVKKVVVEVRFTSAPKMYFYQKEFYDEFWDMYQEVQMSGMPNFAMLLYEDKEKKKLLKLAFDAISVTWNDQNDEKAFCRSASTIIPRLLEFFDIKYIQRLGMRTICITKSTRRMEKLQKKFLEAFIKYTPNGATNVDPGYAATFDMDDGRINLMSGPVTSDEIKAKYNFSDPLPNVGVFTDIDYFYTGKIVLDSSEFAKKCEGMIDYSIALRKEVVSICQ
jgi:hypothetical protein